MQATHLCLSRRQETPRIPDELPQCAARWFWALINGATSRRFSILLSDLSPFM